MKNLYRKFDIDAPRGGRRVALGNEAVRRRAIELADLREEEDRR